VEQAPDNPEAHLALSRAARATGRRMDEHEQLGLYFLLRGNDTAAYQELEAAYRHTAGNPRARARIEAQLQQIERRAETRDN
jgi:predicted Zn-dependent protease